MHTVQLLLKPTTYERAEIERRFHAVSHIHNVCVKRMRKQIALLLKDEEYRNWRTEYDSLSKIEKPSKAEKKRKKALASDMNTRRTKLGLSRSNWKNTSKSVEPGIRSFCLPNRFRLKLRTYGKVSKIFCFPMESSCILKSSAIFGRSEESPISTGSVMTQKQDRSSGSDYRCSAIYQRKHRTENMSCSLWTIRSLTA